MQEARFAAAVAALGDAQHTIVVLVARPDRAALREADRTSGELEALGIRNQHLVVNAVFEATDRTDRVAVALEQRGREALREMPPRLQELPTRRIPLRAFNMVGLPSLRALLDDRAAAALTQAVSPLPTPFLPPLQSLIDEIAGPGRGLVMVMGKGGVGKTTIAAAIAVALASRGHHVLLTTTDPAAHVAATLAGELENLHISQIDPVAETKTYVDRMMANRGASLDDAGRALLAEDLRSPCYEEIAVFAAFSRIVSQARSSFVILDTAPTGHTLLLLDATGSYHRQMVADEDAHHASGHIVTPLMKLRDPQYTKILLVTLAETTPVSEAARLQADLRRARIEPFAWVINSSLAATGSTDPLPHTAHRGGARADSCGARTARSQDRHRSLDDRGAHRPHSPAGLGARRGSRRAPKPGSPIGPGRATGPRPRLPGGARGQSILRSLGDSPRRTLLLGR